MSLIEAADYAGVSKKTLDEYFNQIKYGYENKFDFNQNHNQKVNILRTFNKNKKENNMKTEVEESIIGKQ